ncbi:MAG: 50S ribosomal protein L19 [Micavibrio aeruginosavorus]|uniref:Large ribosomal subunit protein bL19 n=1 Tax=Micavibrio aeruginosavorus TaxID=349221 RepID=A0A2W5A373_9BACT|nr:MAG: 50S ribosomal protein L19 [Micavibrio aeruginosavorus]
MANTLQKFEARQIEKLSAKKNIPDFSPGDTVKVNIRIKEGERERIQAYEGLCIARFGGEGNINASFTVRKISLGEGVERVFPLFSPTIESVELVRRGSVRRAKLYYLRDRRGKSARITERTTGHGLEVEAHEDDNLTKTQKVAKKKEAKKAASAEARKAQEAKEKAKADAKAAEAAAAAAPAEQA